MSWWKKTESVKQDNFFVLERKRISPIYLYVGDSLNVTWRRDDTNEILYEATMKADRRIIYNEIILFETYFEGRAAFGTMAVEAK